MSKQTSEAAEYLGGQLQTAMEEAAKQHQAQIREDAVEEDNRPQIFKDGNAFEAELLRLVTKIIEEKKPQLSEHVFSELEARKNEVKHYNNMLAMHVVTFLENLRPITESLKTARNKLETEQELLNSKYDLVFAGIREADEEYKHFNEAISFLRRFVRNK